MVYLCLWRREKDISGEGILSVTSSVEIGVIVLELKNVIELKSKISRAEQTLFFQEKLMQDDLDLRIVILTWETVL